MTSRDFCYWLQGFFELYDKEDADISLSNKAVTTIENHLALVFKHEIDPSFGDAKTQEILNQIHNTPQPPKPAQRTHLKGLPTPGLPGSMSGGPYEGVRC